jgi:hypothetical protein
MSTVTRVQLDFPEDKVKELDALMKEGEIRTRKDLFNNALTLLVWAVNETREGRVVTSINEGQGTYKQLAMPIFDAVARNAKKKREAEREPARARV